MSVAVVVVVAAADGVLVGEAEAATMEVDHHHRLIRNTTLTIPQQQAAAAPRSQPLGDQGSGRVWRRQPGQRCLQIRCKAAAAEETARMIRMAHSSEEGVAAWEPDGLAAVVVDIASMTTATMAVIAVWGLRLGGCGPRLVSAARGTGEAGRWGRKSRSYPYQNDILSSESVDAIGIGKVSGMNVVARAFLHVVHTVPAFVIVDMMELNHRATRSTFRPHAQPIT